jgi:molybdopterin biosynthesis enzyme MoaB
MDKQLRDNIVKGLGKEAQRGPALRSWLEEHMERIQNVENIPDDKDFAIEAKSNKKAIKILRELFDFLYPKKVEKKEKPNYE